MTVEPERLQRLLGDDDLRWLLTRIRQRIERGQPLDGQVILSGVSLAQRRAVDRLFGRHVGRGRTISIRLTALDALVVRAGVAPDLRSAVEALTGGLRNWSAEREVAAQSWARATAALERAVAVRAELEPWLAWVRATGMLQRVARGDPELAYQLAGRAERILTRLPADGVPLSVLASEAGGDGHALDGGRPLSVLLLRATARLGGVPDGEGAEWRRTVWASVGVLCGELTNPVLTLNLPGDCLTPTGRMLACFREVGQPVHLTARQLLQDQPQRALHGAAVYVCENPTVVAEAANRLGAACAPLVCVSGHPAAAATVLLRQLASAGADLRYHGDFDWSGIAIANGVIGRFGARPWRFDSRAYRNAVERGGPSLRGKPQASSWDAELTDSMRLAGVKVEEERVLPDLLADLTTR